MKKKARHIRRLTFLVSLIVFVSAFGFAQGGSFDFESGSVPSEFTMGGNADWVVSSGTSSEGSYSLRAGNISHNQRSEIRYTGTVPAGQTLVGVSFARRVSSESNYDHLEFDINGQERESWSGNVGWGTVSFNMNVNAGQRFELVWRYRKDGSVNRYEDTAWIDNIHLEFTQVQSTGGSASNFNFSDGRVPSNFAMGGNSGWVISSGTSSVGSYSLRAGNISHNQRSEVRYTGIVPEGQRLAGVSFARRVSSESNYDHLEFDINGQERESWSGDVGWGPVSFTTSVNAGQRFELVWRYRKDGSVNSRQDTAWIDDIRLEFTPVQPVQPTVGSASNFNFSDGRVPSNFAMGGNSGWVISSGTSSVGSYSLRAGNISHNQRSEVRYTGIVPAGQRLAGVSFARRVSSESSFDHLEFDINGQERESWSGDVGWGLVSFTTSVNAGQRFELVWRYRKDGSVNSRQDTAWIDDIRLEFTPVQSPGPTNVTSFDFANGQVPWNFGTSGNSPWNVTGGTSLVGLYSLRAGNISHNQRSEVSYAGIVPAGRTLVGVSFARRVSSESSFDHLEFDINGQERDSWSGDVGWGTVSFNTNVQSNQTFELVWRYRKDGSIDRYEDTAWIDDIRLEFR